MKVLLVVESPIKAKKFRGYFPHFDVIATVGHFKDLPKKEFGVEPPLHQPQWQVMEGKQQVVSKLKAAAKTADIIYVATDPDREGEAIAGHVVNTLGKAFLNKVARITYSEISKPALEKAIAAKRAVDWPLVRAQEARRVLDRYVGYLVSPELTRKLEKEGVTNALSAGRVQSIALKLIVERKEEIDTFKPIKHYGIRARLIKAGIEFDALWKPQNPTGQLVTELGEAKAVIGRTNTLKLISLDRTPKKVSAPKPLITSSYVRLMAGVLKLTTKQSMEAAQKLFEQGLITYHRTDSPIMSEDFIVTARDFATRHKLPIPTAAKQFKASANAQAGHECLRVTDINLINARAAGVEDSLLQSVYRMVWMISLESQLADGEDTITAATFENQSKDSFITKTLSRKTLGWRQASVNFTQSLEAKEATTALDIDKESDEDTTVASLPELHINDSLTPLSVDLLTKQTEPPSHYTEKTLVEKLDKLGIGRPSTYAQTIERIISVAYVTRHTKTLRLDPTPLGITTMHALNNGFSFMDYAYTATIEKSFDLIADRKAEYLPIIDGAWKSLQEEVNRFKDAPLPIKAKEGVSELTVKQPVSTTAPSNKKTPAAKSTKPDTAPKKSFPGDKCPSCDKGILSAKTIKNGSNLGRAFVGCSQFPHCKFFQWMQ